MTDAQKLVEAEAALHRLLTGQQSASFSISSGGGSRSMTYTQTNIAQLRAYIAELKRAIAGGAAVGGRQIAYGIPE